MPITRYTLPLALIAAASLSGCAMFVPGSGPSTASLAAVGKVSGIDVIDLNGFNLTSLEEPGIGQTFARLPKPAAFDDRIDAGQTIEIAMWESAPAVLLAGGGSESGVSARGGSMVLPSQSVALDGSVTVPFVGHISVAGRTTAQVERQITSALRGKANDIQVLVRITGQSSQRVTVIGDVMRGTRVELSPKRERLLDAIAAAGGVNGPIERSTVQISRDGSTVAMPLDTVVRRASENIVLAGGDIVTVYREPKSFIALGAVSKQAEISFEGAGITLAQALARAGGGVDTRADPSGLFLFRATGTKRTIYRLSLRDPASIFILKTVRVEDGDVLFVSNSPAADFQKFVSILGSAVYPFDAVRNFSR